MQRFKPVLFYSFFTTSFAGNSNRVLLLTAIVSTVSRGKTFAMAVKRGVFVH